MRFQHLAQVRKSDIPLKTRKSKIASLSFWPEIEQIAEATRKEGTAPFEEAIVIDMAEYKKDCGKLKQPIIGVLVQLRKVLKQHKVDKKLNIIHRGERIFLVA